MHNNQQTNMIHGSIYIQINLNKILNINAIKNKSKQVKKEPTLKIHQQNMQNIINTTYIWCVLSFNNQTSYKQTKIAQI